jgi:hypothetical protein
MVRGKAILSALVKVDVIPDASVKKQVKIVIVVVMQRRPILNAKTFK